jgi:hypothetical protein
LCVWFLAAGDDAMLKAFVEFGAAIDTNRRGAGMRGGYGFD